MITTVLRIGAVTLLAAAVAGMPLQLLAQSTNKPAAEKKPAAGKAESAPKKKSARPFHGKLAAVDLTAKTIQVGKSTYHITSETKITKAGQPATLADGVVGEPVSGYVEPTEGDKMAARTVRFGAKAEEKSTEKKKKKAGQG
jgi:hypothetical protein